MENQKIVLLFPDGVGIRNYLYSNVFKETKEDLVLFHDFDEKTINTLKESTSITDAICIPEYKESWKEKLLKELICLSRLYYNSKIVNNPSILTNWNWDQKSLSKKIFYKTIEKIVIFYKKYDSILALEKKYQKAIRQNPFYIEVKEILKEIEPKLLFCSHQRGLKVATIFAAAHDLGIVSTTVIYSWDNLPKARLALRADNYLVWSAYMKKEMELYYPEISPSSIHITGTPQFEFYEDQNNIMEKEFFFKKYNLDSSKKIICFSGDDIKTSPDDHNYLKDIADELLKTNMQDQFQILLRRCPVDFSGRFDAIVNKYSDIIKEAPPLWHFNTSKEWNAVYPDFEDVKLLVSIAYYADVVVNVGSTMAFDFAMFDKPCIFINYDQHHKVNPDWSVKQIYQFQHFRSMPTKNAVIWWNEKKNFPKILQETTKIFDNRAIGDWISVVMDDAPSTASKKIKNSLNLC